MEPNRYRFVLGGAVQGVVLRPFVYRLARSLELAGYVQNSSDGVVIEVEGSADRLSDFAARLSRERPAAACVTSQRSCRVPPQGAADFVIAGSEAGVLHAAGMLNDRATCSECLQDVLDPANRRYSYPFANCTACGPRFTDATRAIDVLRDHAVSQRAVLAGRVTETPAGLVVLQSRIGGSRVLDLLSGEQLPRIC